MSETHAGIMPLVDEVHRLRNENELLKKLLDEQSVRIDQMLTVPQTRYGLRDNLRWVDVDVNQLDALVVKDMAHVVADKLATALLPHVHSIAAKTMLSETDSRTVRYRFAFVSMGGK